MRKPSLTLAFGVLVLGGAASAVVSSTTSCMGNKTVDVGLEDPGNLRAQSKYVQLAIFADQCPADDHLANGDTSGAIKSQTIPVDGAFADVGDLKKAKYGFAALLRQDDCAVVGFGCTPVDLEKHLHITIQMSPVLPKPAGGCDSAKGETCNNGVCGVPVPEAGPGDTGVVDGDAEAGPKPQCTLTLVQGAGKDFQAPGQGNVTVTGPVAVPTPSGFIAIYHEANATNADATRLPIDDNGAPQKAVIDTLTACPSSSASDGITAGWNTLAAKGLMSIASPACGDAGSVGAVFTSFDDKGAKLASVVPSPLPYELKFQNVSGTVADTTSFLVAALEKKPTEFHPQVFALDDSLTATYSGNQTFPNATFVRIGSASNIVALAFDKAGDAGPGAINFYVSVPNGTFSPQTYAAGTTAAIGAWQDKAMLAIPTSTGVQWVVRNNAGLELNKGTLATTGVTTVDVVALNDHFIVVAGQPKGISMYRFDIGDTTITAPTSPVVLPTSPLGNTSLDKFDGTMMSAAGARNRVIITWLNKPGPLGEAVTPGGYALFQCDG